MQKKRHASPCARVLELLLASGPLGPSFGRIVECRFISCLLFRAVMVLVAASTDRSMTEPQSKLASDDASNMHLLFLLAFERCLKHSSDTFGWSDLASAWALLMRCVQDKKSTSHQKGVFIHWIPDMVIPSEVTLTASPDTHALFLDRDQCLALFETLLDTVPQLKSQQEDLLAAFEQLKSNSNWKVAPNEAQAPLLTIIAALIGNLKARRMAHLKHALSLTDQVSLQ